MRKQIGFCALLMLSVLLSNEAWSQDPAPATPARHFLWEVKGPHTTVYLLGSIHLLRKADYPLAQPIERAFDTSQIAVFETDLGQMEKPAMVQKLAREGRLADSQTLDQVLAPETYARFRAQVENAGLPANIFDSTQPAIAAMTLEEFQLHRLGFDPDYGVDRYFYLRALWEGKQIIGLEPVDFQFRLVTSFSKQEGELLMESTLDQIDETKAIFTKLLKAWQTGDAAKLQLLVNDSMRKVPTFFKRTVTDRNQAWLPQIEGLLRGDKTAMVIVGAGHLVGNEGLVALLQRQGFSVIQE